MFRERCQARHPARIHRTESTDASDVLYSHRAPPRPLDDHLKKLGFVSARLDAATRNLKPLMSRQGRYVSSGCPSGNRRANYLSQLSKSFMCEARRALTV